MRPFSIYSTTPDCPLPLEPLSVKRRPQDARLPFRTISLAEVVYLIEKNRLPPSAYEEPTQALADPEHVFTEAVFTAAIVQARRQVSRAELPDMPDRMVAATAVYFDVPVVSRDRRIRAASLKTVW
jgi:predicted nucleic acid-binding protein